MEEKKSMTTYEPIHQLVYWAKLQNHVRLSAVRAQLQSNYKEVNEGISQVRWITGIVLLYESSYLCIVEGERRRLISFINMERQQSESDNGILKIGFIIHVSYNILSHHYPSWSIFEIQPHMHSVTKQEDHVPKVLETVLSKLCDLEAYADQFTEAQWQVFLDTLVSRTALLLPDEATLFQLAEDFHDLGLRTLKEFFERYATPESITLDEDVVWPVPKRWYVASFSVTDAPTNT